MFKSFSLQSLYQKQIKAFPCSNCLEREVQHIVTGQKVCLESILESEFSWNIHHSDEKATENWNDLLALALLSYLSDSNPQILVPEIRRLLIKPWNENSQYLEVIIALVHCLVGLPVPDFVPRLLEGGAAPIDIAEYRPWQALPYMPCHAEFGVYLTCLAFLTNHAHLKDSVERLANWQLNILDAHFFPFRGLFAQEKRGGLGHNLLWNSLFFRIAAYLTRQSSFETAAQALFDHLEQLDKQESVKILPLMVLIEKVFEKEPAIENIYFPLPEQIYDPSAALIGMRSPSSQVVCTLHGGQTGLGCLRLTDTEIVSYGPQHLPLGDCQGFGIEGNQLSDQGIRKTTLQLNSQGFLLKGCVRLIDQPLAYPSSSQLGQLRGIWLETELEWRERQLRIETNFLGFDGWDSLAFSFFIKAKRCWINGETSLHPRTFDRYEGKAQTLKLEGQSSSFKLDTSVPSCHMQVIPLGGGNSFWGADFLVAYLLDSRFCHYTWQISLS